MEALSNMEKSIKNTWRSLYLVKSKVRKRTKRRKRKKKPKKQITI